MMVPEMEKPRVTEIKVRMDCNGCVQKIKKALHGITGIYDLYIDFPQQKITIIGWADPVKIVKAIKKTRKSAVICSHTEQSDQPAEQTDGGGAPDDGAPPPPESDEPPQTEAAAAPEAPSSEPDNSPPQEASADSQLPKPKEPEEVHVINHYPPDYGHRYPYGHYHHHGQGNGYPTGPVYTHSYNMYKPSPYVTEYVHPPANPSYFPYNRPNYFSQVYYNGNSSNDDNNNNDNNNGNNNGDGNEHTPQPVNVTHGYNAYKPSPYVTEYSHPHPPPSYSHYNRPDHYSQVYYNGNIGNGNGNDTSAFREDPPQPVYGTHNYNTYKPSPYVTEYVHPLAPPSYSPCSRPDQYSQVYYNGNSSNGNGNGNGNITSMFSEENPNACTIV